MANPKKPALRLRVGGVYESREGQRVAILSREGDMTGFYFTGDDGMNRWENGFFRSRTGHVHDRRDLIRDLFKIRPIPEELKEAFEGAARRSAEFNEWLKNPVNEAKWLKRIAREIAQEGTAHDAMLAKRAKGGER